MKILSQQANEKRESVVKWDENTFKHATECNMPANLHSPPTNLQISLLPTTILFYFILNENVTYNPENNIFFSSWTLADNIKNTGS